MTDFSRLKILQIGDASGLRLTPDQLAKSGLEPGAMIFVDPNAQLRPGDIAIWHGPGNTDALFVTAVPENDSEIPGELIGRVVGQMAKI